MAIAQVTAFTIVATGGTSISMGSSANTVAFVFIVVAPGPITQAPTIGGTNMTAVGSGVTMQGVRVGQWYYMINPPTGAQTVAGNNVANYDNGACIVFSGIHQTTPVDSFGSATSQASPITLTTTVVATGCWLLGACNNDTGNTTAAGGSFDNTTRAGISTVTMANSNATVGTGSQSGTFTLAGATFGGIVLSIAPAGGATVNNLSLLGVGA